MTEPIRSLTPDLDGTTCTVTECLAVGDTVAAATIGIPSDVGSPEESLDLGLVLCADHSHLLRMGGSFITIETDL